MINSDALRCLICRQLNCWKNECRREIERQLNAARTDLAERKPQLSGDIALNVRHPDCHKAADAFWQYWRKNGVPHKHGYYESTWGAINQALRHVGVISHEWSKPPDEVTGTTFLGDCIAATPESQPSGDEQARFEAWFSRYAPTAEERLDDCAKDAWNACVAAHQPQGSPVAYRYKAVGIIDGVERVLIKEIDPNRQEYELVDSAHDYSHLSFPLNYPTTNEYEPLYTADQWPQSPCPHLSTSKDGASYCKLAEADAKDAVHCEEIDRLRRSDAILLAVIFWLETNQPDVFRRGIWDSINSAATAAHGEKPCQL